MTRRPSEAALRRGAWAVPVFLLVTYGVAMAALLADPQRATGSWESGGSAADLLFLLVLLTFPFTGLLILRRQPRNRIGWLLEGIGAAWGLSAVTDIYAAYGFEVRPGALPHPEVAVALGAGSWAPGIGLMGTFLLLLYPDGHLPSRRWRPVAWAAAVTILVVTMVIALSPGPIGTGPRPALENPLGIEGARTLLAGLLVVFLPLLPLCILASAASLVVRFRRARGVERFQLKWLTTAGSVVALAYLVGMAASLPRLFASEAAEDPAWLNVFGIVASLSFVLLPLAIGVAILRHRLYDIDLVINRTLVYGSLTALLAGCYLGSVLLLQVALSPVTSRSDLAVAVSTLVVAAAFRPARAKVQHLVDRRFFRRRYDAARILDAFATRLRHEVDLEAVGADLRGVVRDTVAPSHVSLWLRGAP